MLDTFKELIGNQFEAAYCTLHMCIESCPDPVWDSPVGNYAFCRLAFHTLFFADLYLGPNKESLKRQPFHRDNKPFFRDYEELEDRAPKLLYDKEPIESYLKHCREKARQAIAVETTDTLIAPCGFGHKVFSRAELHVYNIRHIQHHAAQLSLRLRIGPSVSIPWVGSGWHDT